MKNSKQGFLLVESMFGLLVLSGFTLIFLAGMALQIDQLENSQAKLRDAKTGFNCMSQARAQLVDTAVCQVDLQAGTLKFQTEEGDLKYVFLKQS